MIERASSSIAVGFKSPSIGSSIDPVGETGGWSSLGLVMLGVVVPGVLVPGVLGVDVDSDDLCVGWSAVHTLVRGCPNTLRCSSVGERGGEGRVTDLQLQCS